MCSSDLQSVLARDQASAEEPGLGEQIGGGLVTDLRAFHIDAQTGMAVVAINVRLVSDATVVGDDFNPGTPVIYLETNATPGLQLGIGGDAVYLAGGNDPVLAHDTSTTIYVTAPVPGGLSPGALGSVALRAVAVTLANAAGTDDPADGAFPTPGTTYPGAGDPAAGGGNSDAVVGASYAIAAALFQALGTYRVTDALVALNKTVVSITDPFGGATIVPGSVIRYQITVDVAGASVADALVVNDPLPATLAFVPASLTASALPAGEQADDDFLPAGSDNTGFDGVNRAVVVTLGSVPGGSATIVITFDATVQ